MGMCVSTSYPHSHILWFSNELVSLIIIMKLYATVFNSGVQVSDLVVRIRQIEVIFFKSKIFLLKIIS